MIEISSSVKLLAFQAEPLALVGTTQAWSKYALDLKEKLEEIEAELLPALYIASNDDAASPESVFYRFVVNSDAPLHQSVNIFAGSGAVLLYHFGVPVHIWRVTSALSAAVLLAQINLVCTNKEHTSMNSLMVIFPYKTGGVWVFDDAVTGLVREPFVDVVNVFIDKLTEDISGAEQGFRMIFSARPFPGYGLSLTRIREEFDGNWYACNELDNQEGWLCPALFKYFDTAPPALYVKAEAMPAEPVAPGESVQESSTGSRFKPFSSIAQFLRKK